MKLGEIAIFTDQVQAVAEFYQRLLNVQPAYEGPGLAIFRVGETQILIHSRYVPVPGDLPCENHTAFAVTDVDQSVAEVERRGLRVDIPPRDYAWGRSAYLRDPDGRLLELQESAG
ncbi:MAG: VOC family protein [Planctomycetaceae bacterium]